MLIQPGSRINFEGQLEPQSTCNIYYYPTHEKDNEQKSCKDKSISTSSDGYFLICTWIMILMLLQWKNTRKNIFHTTRNSNLYKNNPSYI